MSRNAVLLEACRIGRRHPDGQGWLVDDVSLRVRDGRRLAVVGASGAGKTVLLRALSLLDPLDEGEIRWRGEPVRRDQTPAFRRQAIYVHQRPALAEATVEAALRQPFSLGAYRRKTFDREQVIRRLEELGRDGSFLDKKVGDLSGGESQIAMLVRVLQLDPVVLLLDEPTAALDRRTARAAEAMLDRWLLESAGARAVVWVTHDPAQARRVADRVLSIEAGRVVGDNHA